jgi:hypothetical protein
LREALDHDAPQRPVSRRIHPQQLMLCLREDLGRQLVCHHKAALGRKCLVVA